MTVHQPPVNALLSAGVKPVLVTVMRTLVSTALVFFLYFQLPVQSDPQKSDIPYLVMHLVVFAIIVAVQVPVIMRSRHPGLRAIEATVLTIVIYLALVARIYLSAAVSNHDAFSQVLSHTTALYFTVTIFATVGFGDIVAQAAPAQLMVTGQMLLNLVVLGVVIKLLITAGARGMARRESGEEPRPLSLRRHARQAGHDAGSVADEDVDSESSDDRPDSDNGS